MANTARLFIWLWFVCVCCVVLTANQQQEFLKCPNLPDGFVSLEDVDRTLLISMRYASHHNFVGTPINGYVQNVCILTKAAATALSSAQKEFMSMSPAYTLKLYDCYRPTMAVHHFKSWAADVNDSLMMLEFYPDMNKSDIIPLGYILEKSGHSRGSTIDVTLVQYPPSPEEEYHPGNVLKPCYSSISERFGDNSIDMGTGFDCFDSRAHTDNTLITQQQRKNRQLLHDVLQRYGFYNYPLEWWHFSLQDEPYVDTYFNFLVSCNATMTVTTPALSDVGFV